MNYQKRDQEITIKPYIICFVYVSKIYIGWRKKVPYISYILELTHPKDCIHGLYVIINIKYEYGNKWELSKMVQTNQLLKVKF